MREAASTQDANGMDAVVPQDGDRRQGLRGHATSEGLVVGEASKAVLHESGAITSLRILQGGVLIMGIPRVSGVGLPHSTHGQEPDGLHRLLQQLSRWSRRGAECGRQGLSRVCVAMPCWYTKPSSAEFAADSK
jgi:hypothetical protein